MKPCKGRAVSPSTNMQIKYKILNCAYKRKQAGGRGGSDIINNSNFFKNKKQTHFVDFKNVHFWDVSPCGTYKNHTAAKDILDSHRRENLKSYIALTGWAL
jgi:hypothetical protein